MTPKKPQVIHVYELIQLLAQYPASWEVWFDATEDGYRSVGRADHRIIDDEPEYRNVVILADMEPRE